MGLEIAAGFNTAQYIKHPAAPWYIVVLRRSRRQYPAPVNRFTLQAQSKAEVETAHRELSMKADAVGVTELREIEHTDKSINFIFSDPDHNWWELTAET